MKTNKIQRLVPIEDLINREYPLIRKGINGYTNFNGCPAPETPIFVEDYVNENPQYGKIDKSFICLTINLNQSIDDMGLFSDIEYESSDFIINTPIDYFKRLTGLPIENYYTLDSYIVTGQTESNLDTIKSYNQKNPYIIGLNMSNDISLSFDGVLSLDGNKITYVLGGQVDNQGKYITGTGVKYVTDFDRLQFREDCGQTKQYYLTTFEYRAVGVRDFNSVLNAIIKDDKYLGVVFPASIDDDVQIDRGTVNVMEKHLRLSEIDSVGQLTKYSAGYYNVKSV